MFYSHEVLTSREHGIATIWLVATLGSKSTLNKKVNKKSIIEVDVSKACETILSPEVPLALRLQSNLLYGVTRVYGEKVGYVLVDAQHAQNAIRTLLRAVRVETTEPEGKHKARPDQLMLQEDSNALLEDILGLDFDPLSDLTTSDSSQISSVLSPHSTRSSGLGSEHADLSIGGLIIPPSASSATGGPGGFSVRGSTFGDDNRGASRFNSTLYARDEPGVLEDAGFDFDAEGELVDHALDQRVAGEPSIETQGPQMRDDILMSDYDDTTLRDQGQANDNWQRDEDDGYLPMQDDPNMSNVEAFPARDREPVRPDSAEAAAEADPDATIETSESSASAPAQRVRQPKVLHNDVTMELHNQDLAQWNINYLANMQTAMHQKLQQRSTKLAKENANFWVLQNGVGGLAYAIGPEEIPEPLRMFTGNALLAALGGLKLSVAGEKRDRQEDAADGQEDDEDGRRVRARSDEVEMGRGDNDFIMDDAGYVGGDDVRDDTIEMGREAPTPLRDNMSSTMPWNVSASIRGSSARPGGAALFSVGGHASSSIVGGPAGSLGGRRSRVVSSSLLVGYDGGDEVEGTFANDCNIPSDDYEGFDQTGTATQGADATGLTLSRRDEDFELFGAAAAVDTQTAGAHSWVREALNSESANFLSFVRAGIEEADVARDTAEETEEEVGELDQKGSVLFERLLPCANNSRVVAAQALLHVLALCTKNLLQAEQKGHFEGIRMRIL